MGNEYAIPILPRTLEVARKLAGDSARERLPIFEKAVKAYNAKAQKTLGVYSLNSDGEFVGGNIFARCLMDMVSPQNTRRANITHLLQISDRDVKYLAGTYEDDNAVVLRSLEDSANASNTYLAKALARKLKVKNIKNPFVVTNLAIKDDERSAYGLVFVTTNSTKVIEAPQLIGKNHGRKFTFYDADGMPIFKDDTDKSGKRQVWTRDGGISRLFLGGYLSLVSYNGGLAYSGDYGRVVELNSEAVGADFEKQLVEMYKSQQSELLKRFENAKKVLAGEK